MSSRVGPVRIFISYSHIDLAHLKNLETHLSNLKRQERIAVWTDQQLLPGTEWNPELLRHLHNAEIVLLLVTPDFIESEFIHNLEVRKSLERHELREVEVVPVLVRPTDMKGHVLARLQGLPRGFLPISEWKSPDRAWLEVVEGVRDLVDILRPENGVLTGNVSSPASSLIPTSSETKSDTSTLASTTSSREEQLDTALTLTLESFLAKMSADFRTAIRQVVDDKKLSPLFEFLTDYFLHPFMPPVTALLLLGTSALVAVSGYWVPYWGEILTILWIVILLVSLVYSVFDWCLFIRQDSASSYPATFHVLFQVIALACIHTYQSSGTAYFPIECFSGPKILSLECKRTDPKFRELHVIRGTVPYQRYLGYFFTDRTQGLSLYLKEGETSLVNTHYWTSNTGADQEKDRWHETLLKHRPDLEIAFAPLRRAKNQDDWCKGNTIEEAGTSPLADEVSKTASDATPTASPPGSGAKPTPKVGALGNTPSTLSPATYNSWSPERLAVVLRRQPDEQLYSTCDRYRNWMGRERSPTIVTLEDSLLLHNPEMRDAYKRGGSNTPPASNSIETLKRPSCELETSKISSQSIWDLLIKTHIQTTTNKSGEKLSGCGCDKENTERRMLAICLLDKTHDETIDSPIEGAGKINADDKTRETTDKTLVKLLRPSRNQPQQPFELSNPNSDNDLRALHLSYNRELIRASIGRWIRKHLETNNSKNALAAIRDDLESTLEFEFGQAIADKSADEILSYRNDLITYIAQGYVEILERTIEVQKLSESEALNTLILSPRNRTSHHALRMQAAALAVAILTQRSNEDKRPEQSKTDLKFYEQLRNRSDVFESSLGYAQDEPAFFLIYYGIYFL